MGSYRCSICNTGFSNLRHLQQHANNHVGAVMCDFCPFLARNNDEMDLHRAVHVPAPRPFPCLIEKRCPSFTTEEQLLIHFTKEHPEITLEEARSICRIPELPEHKTEDISKSNGGTDGNDENSEE